MHGYPYAQLVSGLCKATGIDNGKGKTVPMLHYTQQSVTFFKTFIPKKNIRLNDTNVRSSIKGRAHTLYNISILQQVDPLLGNDREISNNTTAIIKQRLHKQACFHGNNRLRQ
jgi:hypothetical protein